MVNHNIAIEFEDNTVNTHPEYAFYNLLVNCGVSTDVYNPDIESKIYAIGNIKSSHYINVLGNAKRYDNKAISMFTFISLCEFDDKLHTKLINLWQVIELYLRQREHGNTMFHELYINKWLSDL